MLPLSNAISDLTSGPRCDVWDGIQGYENDDDNLSNALEKKEITLAECIVTMQLTISFIFRRMDNAERIVRQYDEFFSLHAPQQPLNTIHRTFYTGLIALHCLRQTEEKYWMDISMHAIERMKTWAEASEWNFENKSLLLNAEHHFSIGDFDQATEEYHLSIASSHKHRFIHEEAIACELASNFHSQRGNSDLSLKLMNRSVECYQSWGAEKKANTLLQMLRK